MRTGDTRMHLLGAGDAIMGRDQQHRKQMEAANAEFVTRLWALIRARNEGAA